jgi:hypothetical protein
MDVGDFKCESSAPASAAALAVHNLVLEELRYFDLGRSCLDAY